MKSTKVSYSFGSIDVKTPKVPSSNYESVPHSVDFIPPKPGLGFLRDIGGVVYGKLFYQSSFNIDNPLDIPHRYWVESYVSSVLHQLTTGEGGLSETAVRGLFSTPSEVLNYTPSTGVFTLDLDLSKYNNSISKFLTAEVDPVFTNSPAGGITSIDKSNWNIAYSWVNENGGKTFLETLPEWIKPLPEWLDDVERYVDDLPNFLTETTSDLIYLRKDDDISYDDLIDKPEEVELADVATSGDYKDLINTPDVLDVLEGEKVAGQFLKSKSDGIEWVTITHDELLDNEDEYIHLTIEEKGLLASPADDTTDGYLSSDDWIKFSSKLNSLVADSPIYITPTENSGESRIFLDEAYLPTNDDAVDDSHTLSAKKIYSLLQGDEEEEGEGEEETTPISYGQSFTIRIPGGADLVTKLGFNQHKLPTDWGINVSGGSSADLEITHSLGKTPASISVYRMNGDSSKSRLEGAVAYGDAKSSDEDSKLTLSSYASTSLATEIRLIF